MKVLDMTSNMKQTNYLHPLFPHVPCVYFIYLGFYVTFNNVQVISRRVVGSSEETSTYSSLGCDK